VDNADMVSDRILSHSSGYVESHEQMGEPKVIDGGLVSVQIRAKVRPMQLHEGLRKLGIRVREMPGGVFQQPFDGKQLFGAALTKADKDVSEKAMLGNLQERLRAKAESMEDILADVLRGYPENYLKARMVGKPKYDDKTAKLSIDIEISLDMEKKIKFLNDLDDVLREIYGRGTTINHNHTINENNIRFSSDFSYRSPDPTIIFVCRTWPNTTNRGANVTTSWKWWKVDKAISAMLRPPKAILDIKLVDKNNEPVLSNRIWAPAGIGSYGSNYSILFFPALNMNLSNNNNYYFFDYTISPGRPVYQITQVWDATKDDLLEIENVLMKFESDKK